MAGPFRFDGARVIKIEGADVLTPLVARARQAADLADLNADRSEIASGAAQATGRYFTTRAAGEAASAVDQAFATDDGAGNVIYYRRTSGGSMEIGRAVTPAGLSAADGSAKVGHRGRPVQSKLDDTVSVKDAQFAGGAKGDGTTDDTEAINAAMDAAIDAGVTLYFPAGNYRVTAPITKHLAARTFAVGGRHFNILGAGRTNTFFFYDGPANQIALSITGNPNNFDLFKIAGIAFRRPDAGYPGLAPKSGEALRLTTMNMVQLQDILTFRSGMGIHLVGCLNVFINGYYSAYDRNGIFAERGVGTDPNFPVNPNANQIALRDFNFVQTSEVGLHLKDGTGLTLGTGAFESIGREPAAAGTPGSPIGLYLEDCGLDGPHVLSGNSSVYCEANLGLDVLIKQRAIDANYDFRGWNFNRAGGPSDRTVNAIRFDASTLPAGVARVTLNVDGVHFNKYGPYTPSALTPPVEIRLGGGSGNRFDGLTFSDLNTRYPDAIEMPAYLDDGGNPIPMAPVSRPTEISLQGFILPGGSGSIERQRGVRSFTKVGPGVFDVEPIRGVAGLVVTATSNSPGIVAYTYEVAGKIRVDCRQASDGAQTDAVVMLAGSYA